MTVNSTLGHVSKDIVWVYTLLEHYTVILSLWVGGFTRINTICLVKKRIQMSLFPLFFSLFCRKTTYTSPEWRRLGIEKSVQRQSQTNKMKHTNICTFIFPGWLLFFLASPKLKDKPSETVCGPFQCLTKSKNFVSFFFFMGDLWAAIHEWWVEETIVPGWLIPFSSSSCFYPSPA